MCACLQVRAPAAELISGLTGSVEGSQKLQQHRGVLLPSLQRLVAELNGSGKAALTALVNLSQVTHSAGWGLHASRRTCITQKCLGEERMIAELESFTLQ